MNNSTHSPALILSVPLSYFAEGLLKQQILTVTVSGPL